MGIASHLSWANLSYSASYTFPNLILFLLLLLCSILLLHAAGDAGGATVDHYDACCWRLWRCKTMSIEAAAAAASLHCWWWFLKCSNHHRHCHHWDAAWPKGKWQLAPFVMLHETKAELLQLKLTPIMLPDEFY